MLDRRCRVSQGCTGLTDGVTAARAHLDGRYLLHPEMDVKDTLVLRRPERNVLAAEGLRNAHDLSEQAHASAFLYAADDVLRFVLKRDKLLVIAAIDGNALAAVLARCRAGRVILRGASRQRGLGSSPIGVLLVENFATHARKKSIMRTGLRLPLARMLDCDVQLENPDVQWRIRGARSGAAEDHASRHAVALECLPEASIEAFERR